MKSWVSRRLDMLTESDSPITYGVIKPGPVGDVLFVRGGDLDFGRVQVEKLRTITQEISNDYKRTVLKGGELLISLVGTPGQVAIVPTTLAGANIARQVGLIRLIPEINKRYVCYYLQSPQGLEALGAETSGAVQRVINLSALRTVEVPIPSPEEQKRIVAILDQAFADIEQARAKTEQNLKNARELFESYLQQVFSQRGEGWVNTDINSLVDAGLLDKPLDGNHGDIHPKKADFVEIGVPFIMASNIKGGTVDTQSCSFLSKTQADALRKGFAKDGDILLSHKATIGRSAILRTDLDYVMLTPQVTYYRVLQKERLSNEYVYWYFNNPIFLNEMNEYAGVGSTRAYIGITKQRKLKFSYPELTTQKKIVSKLQLMSKEVAALQPIYRKKLLALDELKKSILQKAFNGELTKDKKGAAA